MFAIGLTIGALAVYHLSARLLPADSDVWLSLSVTYAVALSLSVGVWAVGGGPWVGVRSLSPAPVALGFAIVGIELGFILAYRGGWPLSSAAAYANLAVVALMLPIGVLGFREELPPLRALGLALAFGALALLTVPLSPPGGSGAPSGTEDAPQGDAP